MKSKQILSLSLAACLMIGSLAGAGGVQAKAKAKKPVLSKTKMTAYIGKTKTLKVKKNGTKKIVKTKWTLSGKKVAKLSKKKKTSVTIKGLKKGSATVKAKVWYQKKGAKKKKKVTLKCKVSVTKYVSPEAKKKANVLNATTKYQPLAKLAAQHGFKLGTVVNYTNVTTNDNYKNLVKYHFNSLTAGNEFKAYSLLDQAKSAKSKDGMPVMNYDKADTIISFAKENGIQMRGHVLVWHAYMCDWFFREGYKTDGAYVSADVMKNRLKMYIDEVMTHFEEKYPGAIYCWDVVNEAVADNAGEFADDDVRHVRQVRGGKTNLFYDYIGSDYVELAFRYAYETREKLQVANSKTNIKLFYNDYNTFATYGANKRDAIIQLVKSINSFESDGNGGYLKLCDGIGMQSYIGGYGQQSGCMNDNDITLVKNAIEKFAENNVEVHVTELAVRNYDNDAEPEHAAFYKKLVQTYVDINKAAQAAGKTGPITSLSIWGLFDAPYLSTADYSYKMNGPYCGLFTELYQPKQSFKEVYEVLAAE